MGGAMPGGSGPAMGGGAAMEQMPFLSTQQSVVPASEIADHGANGWVSLVLTRGLSLNLGVARSIPFHLTTARVGLNFDVGRLLFR